MMRYEHNGVVVRVSRESDIAALSGRLRDADEKEVIAAGNESGGACLESSFARSTLRYTVDLQGVPVAMFGIVPDSILGPSANVWFLGAPEMSHMKKTFMRLSLPYIRHFLTQYSRLWNTVDARYEKSLSWLKFCGAEFLPAIQINGFDFIPFVIRRA